MRTRDAVLEYRKTLDDTGTLIKDIDITDPISAFYLCFRGTNGSTSNKGNFLSDVITKVEIVDGAEVLYSLNLSQLEALQFYKTGITPGIFSSEWPDKGSRHNVYLLFGRHLWDTEFGFNPGRYTNPQLKITTNIAAIRAASATTAYTTGSLNASIVAKIMEDTPAPAQYLAAKEIDSFTAASSGDKRVDLPVDLPIRMMMFRAYEQLSDIDEIITDVKLTADADKFVLLNRKVKQMDAEALMQFGVARLKHDIFCSDLEAVRGFLNKEAEVDVYYDSESTATIVGVAYCWSNEIKLNIQTDAGAKDGTDRQYTLVEHGHALHATWPHVFGKLNDPNTWLNPRQWRKLEAVLTQDDADGVVEIVVEQVRS